jgi:hypothetical protein
MQSAASRTTFAHVIPQPMIDDWNYGDLLYVLRGSRPQSPLPQTTMQGDAGHCEAARRA